MPSETPLVVSVKPAGPKDQQISQVAGCSYGTCCDFLDGAEYSQPPPKYMGVEMLSSLTFAGMLTISQQQEMLAVTKTAMVSHSTVFEVSLAHDF